MDDRNLVIGVVRRQVPRPDEKPRVADHGAQAGQPAVDRSGGGRRIVDERNRSAGPEPSQHRHAGPQIERHAGGVTGVQGRALAPGRRGARKCRFRQQAENGADDRGFKTG